MFAEIVQFKLMLQNTFRKGILNLCVHACTHKELHSKLYSANQGMGICLLTCKSSLNFRYWMFAVTDFQSKNYSQQLFSETSWTEMEAKFSKEIVTDYLHVSGEGKPQHFAKDYTTNSKAQESLNDKWFFSQSEFQDGEPDPQIQCSYTLSLILGPVSNYATG